MTKSLVSKSVCCLKKIPEKFQNKYRISSARLQNWNYGWNAPYFVTICTKNRECYFGEIVDRKMVLSNIGIVADILWYEIKNHAKNIDLDAFVVMPNHWSTTFSKPGKKYPVINYWWI